MSENWGRGIVSNKSRSYLFEGFELLENSTLLANAITCGEQCDVI